MCDECDLFVICALTVPAAVVLLLAGAVPVIVHTTPEQGFLISPEQLQAVLTPKSRLLILCTPSNPTGMS